MTGSADTSGDCLTVGPEESIQDAIDAADPWETICVETGTYDESVQVATEGITIVAASGADPVLQGSSGTGIEVDGAHNVTIEGLTIQGYDSNGVRVTGDGHNLTVRDTHIEDSGRGIWLENNAASNAVLEDNEIVNNGVRAIHIGENNEGVEVRGNHIADNGGVGINARYAPHAVVVDNVLEGNSGNGIAIWDEYAVVRNNTLNDNGNVAIRISHDGDHALVEGNEVTGGGVGIEATTVDSPEIRNNTITNATVDVELDRVQTATIVDNDLETGIALDGSADTLEHFDHVATGNTIGDDPLVFVSGEDDPEIPDDAAQVIVVDSTNVEVSGHAFDGVTSGIQIAYSPNAVVTENDVSNTGSHGIRVWSSDDAVVSGNELVSNGETSHVSGIGIHGSAGAVVADNTITDSSSRALSVGGSPDAIVRNNSLIDNHNGLFLSSSDRLEVTDNEITGTHHGGTTSNFRSAILVTSGEFVEIRGNEITDNHVNGIHDNRGSNSQYVTIEDNLIANNGNEGIYWSRSHDATIQNNTVTDNGRAGINGPSRAIVTDNDVSGNSVGIDVSHDSLVANNVVQDNRGNGVEANADSTVRDNTIVDNGNTGIYFRNFDGQLVEDNEVSGHAVDLWIHETADVTVRHNSFESGVLLRSHYAESEELTTHSFVNNTVGDRPLHYVRNDTGVEVPDDVGQVIVVNSTDVTVSGLEFEGVPAPVQVAYSDAVTVADNTIANGTDTSTNRGAITVWESTQSTIQRNAISEMGDRTIGIELINGGPTEIANNTITDVGWNGITVDDVDAPTIAQNTVTDAGRDAITVTNGDALTITQNTVTGADGDGIHTTVADEGSGADLANNTVSNTERGIVVEAQGWSAPIVNVTVLDNVLEHNSVAGLEVTDEAEDVQVHGNGIQGNGDGIVYSEWDPEYALNATNNWWGAANGPSGGATDPETGAIADGDGDTVDEQVLFDPWLGDTPIEEALFDVSIVSTNSPVAETESLTVEVAVENTGDAQGTQDVILERFDGTVVDTASVTLAEGQQETVTLEWETGAGDAGTGHVTVQSEDTSDSEHVTVEAPSSAQLVITEPGVYELDDDLTLPGDEPAVIVASSDVVFDGNGHTITSESGGTAIAAQHVENVTVRDLTLENWQYGIEFEHVENALIEDVTAIDIGQSGIWLTTVTDSTVRNNDLIENRDGIVLRESSTGNLVESNTVAENRRYGFAVRHSSDNTLSNNDVTGVEDHGFFVTSSSSGNKLVENTVTDSGSSWGDSGFHVRGDDNVLEDNVATGSYSEGFGIRGDGNALENNTAQDSGREGFRLVDANDNVLTNTTATGSDTHGIRFWNAVGNELETVTAHDNGDWDVFFWDGSQDNTVSELTVGESVAETTLDVDGTDAGIEGVETVPPAPDDTISLDAYFVAAAEESGGSLTVEVPYEATDLEEVDEETLALWDYNDDAQEWSPVVDSSVDTDERVVTATLTSDSTFGVFGDSSQSEIEVTETSLSDTNVDTGSVVTIDAAVQNVGDAAGSQTVDLEVDGEVVDEEAVTLESGQTTDLTFTHQFDHAGEFDVVVAGEFVGTVTVSEPADDPEPAFFGVELLETNAPVQAGDSLEVSATVENTGEEADTQSIELVAGGAVVDSADVTLDEGETETVTLTWTTGADDVGEAIPLEVRSDDDTDTATVAVEEPAGDGELVVYGAEADRSHVALDETVTVSGDLYNGGDAVTTETVALEVDGEVVDEATASVPPGISRDGVELSWTPTAVDLPDGEEEMNVTLTLDGFVVDTVTVENQYSDVQVIAASVSEVEAVEGDDLYVVGSIYQNGTIDGPEEIELTATNTETNETEVLGTRDVTLEPGFYHLGALNVSFTPDEAGTYELELGERAAGTIEVLPAESDVQVIAASVSEVEAVEGDDLYVVGSIYQNGTIDGPEEIELIATNTETNETEVLGTRDVTLEPGFYHLGALNVSFTPEEAGTYELELGERAAGTIDVEAAESDIDVIAASVSEVEAVEGDELYVVGSIYQGGNVEGPETIELTATNTETNETEVLETRDVTLEPGFYHLGALNVSFTPDEAGTYELELGERAAGTIEVLPAESDVQVIAASVSEVEAVEGDELYVVGSIYQNGTIEGPETIELTATNTETNETEVLGTRDVTLEPGFYHLGALNVSFTPDEAGTYELELGERAAGTIEVEAAESDVQVIAASVSEVEAVEGDELYVVGSIYQNGTIDGPETIELTATNTDTNETEVLGTRDVTLEPGFYHLGALNVSFTPDEAGTYDLELGERHAGTIEVEEAYSDITVIAASVSEVEVLQGEELYVTGSIYQGGNVDGPETIELTATNTDTNETEVLGTQEVTLEPGFYHLGALNISFTPDEPGDYDLELGGREVGTITVDEVVTDIRVIGSSVSAVEVIEGEPVHVTGSIYQNGSHEATETIELTATNTDTGESEVVGSQDVTLEPGYYHLGALNITFTPDEPGTYDLELGDHNAGTVEVDPAESDIQVIAASVSEIEAVEGDDLYVVGSIYQNGTIDGPEEIELTATNTDTGETEVLRTQDVTLEPGFYHLGALNVSFTPDEAGTYELELGERAAGTIEVLPAESDVQVIAASVSEVEAVEGDELYVVGSIYQNGTIDGPEEIELTATNTETNETEVLGTRDVTLEPGFYHLGALNISFTPDEAGTYELELGERAAGAIEVLPAESDVQVIAASVSEVEAVEGDELYVVGSIYQNGTIDGPETIELTATNTETNETEVLGARDVTLEPGFYHLGALNVSFALDEAGTYELELGERAAGTIEVQSAESDVQVIAASVSAVELAEGESAYAIGSIYQAGTIEGPETIELTATNTETGEIEVLGSQEVTLEPGWYHLGALNVSFTIEEAGTYDLELGDRNAGTFEVVEPTVEPTVVAVEGYSSSVDPETGADLEYASDDATVEIDVDADLDLEEVTLLVDSLETTYTVPVDATHQSGDRWHASVPLDALPDDGRYALSVIAVDERDNAGMADASEILVIDREKPSLSVTIVDVDGTDATVIVESDEPLDDVPVVSAELTDADVGATSSEDLEMEAVDGDGTEFTGTLEFDESGEYTVTAVGTDRAGNVGTDTASVVVDTRFTLADGAIVFEETGTTIEFDLVDDADDAIKSQELFVALSENTVNANLDGGELGVGFLTADLDSFIDYHLEDGTIEEATISLAIDEAELPGDADLGDVELHHHDEPADEWTTVDSSVEYLDDEPFAVADVSRFSTYGVLVIDEEPPELVDVSPDPDDRLEAETDEVTVRFEYEDALSGVDVRSIALSIDGVDVTDDDATQITSTTATHTLTVDDGNSYTATVTVADEAGNDATYETSFDVDELDDEPDTPSPPPSTDPDPDDSDDSDDGDSDDRDDSGTDDDGDSDDRDDSGTDDDGDSDDRDDSGTDDDGTDDDGDSDDRDDSGTDDDGTDDDGDSDDRDDSGTDDDGDSDDRDDSGTDDDGDSDDRDDSGTDDDGDSDDSTTDDQPVPADDDDEPGADDDSTPGFGAGFLVVVIVSSALAIARRRS
ncbi:right-handed parallel beta-helix repeat-containing protein [Natronobeatus ordinarius]|uniref:right-handed parallel beta-helix repeat-containing protein n=1 Tax=Natronobeatus ordinarius TaxID=2963433 RepID=UPI0020CCCC3E|nr:right-handed parallel beta-helix repeat-containing protein [Natronobeatus ordinarius]